MAVSAVGQTPFAIYARESAQAASATPLRARVVTTEAGLSLGRFGITYTSRDVEFLDDAPAAATPSGIGGFSRSESFAAALEAATLSQSAMSDAGFSDTGDWTAPLASRPYAAAAYAAASTAGLTPPPSRTLLATV
ncbi:MAG: hypothetical protein RDU30_13345 [Desulfovibrionaceae bacterium]|nr:hypothetical protein [Desulfovibrionaceae bacterium]